MTSKLNLFFTIIVALMLVAVLVLQVNSAQLPGAAESSQSEQSPTSEITVTGEATASAPPDVAYVNIGVQASAATADGAVKNSNATMTAVTKAITGAGAYAEQVQPRLIQMRLTRDKKEVQDAESNHPGQVQVQKQVGNYLKALGFQ